ncbi:MAG TPA: hypothetical protein VNO30_50355 [Kofleriaceae bacterium]|nr:hypothetical protein [Kofleriaceae bacterium]
MIIRGSIAIVSALALVSSACEGGKRPPNMPPDALVDPPPDAPVGPIPDAPPAPQRQTVAEVAATPNRDLDLLFVVDDSPSMLDKQQNLKANFPRFIEALQLALGGLPNLHIGVVSTDMGTKASGSATPAPAIGQIGQGGCSGTGKGGALQIGTSSITDRYLIDIAQPGGTRLVNYPGMLADAFGQLANLGAGGCGFEQPLAAMRAALDNHPANTGFLRAGAMLGVIFLSDEDDCSAKSTTLFDVNGAGPLGPLQSFRCTRFGVTCAIGGQTSDAMNQVGAKSGCAPSVGSAHLDDVAPYRAFLAGLKTDPRRVVVGGILGDVTPFAVELRAPPGGGTPLSALAHSCSYQGSSNLEVADPAVRLKALLDGFPARSSVATVCQQDLSAGLTSIGGVIRQALAGSCIDVRLTDTDAGTPGLQPDCLVDDVVGAAATPVPSCAGSPAARPCWRLSSEPTACAASPAPNLQLVIDRAAAPDPATVTRARCVVAP